MDKTKQGWEKLLHPQTLRTNLLLASLYFAAWELLREAVIDRIRSFFTYGGLDDGKPLIDEQYEKVEQLHKSLLAASCSWLQQNGVISMDDVAKIQALREHRNEIAHDLPAFLCNVDREVDLELFRDIRQLLKKIELWWVRNVDMAINPDFDGAFKLRMKTSTRGGSCYLVTSLA